MTLIRTERPEDGPTIDAVHRAAFETEAEAMLVRSLRHSDRRLISLVAERQGHVVGHILFSPVTIEGQPGITSGLGLAPVAVQPVVQRQGIGSQLIEVGLQECRAGCCGFVVVLGHPEFYRRFGFKRASGSGLTNAYGVDEPFMVIELTAGSIPPQGGLVRYSPEFDELG